MSSALRPALRPSKVSSIPLLNVPNPYICQQCRHARLLRRPKRPYTFTQLVTLSDGSAFTMRTTSPLPVYRSTRDTRNSPLWNPRSRELANVEDDEAGRLARFRSRYGTGFDANKQAAQKETTTSTVEKSDDAEEFSVEEDFTEDDVNLLDLISSYGQENAAQDQVQIKEQPKEQSKKAGKAGSKKK